MDNNSMKQIKKIFTDMFAEQYKKYATHEKSISNMINMEKCFLFHFKSSFHSRENEILEFQIFNFHDVIKCPNIKQETYFAE